jgi:hypothetical protein
VLTANVLRTPASGSASITSRDRETVARHFDLSAADLVLARAHAGAIRLLQERPRQLSRLEHRSIQNRAPVSGSSSLRRPSSAESVRGLAGVCRSAR